MFLEKQFDSMMQVTLPPNHPIRNDAEFVKTLRTVFFCGAHAGAELIREEVKKFTIAEVVDLLGQRRQKANTTVLDN